MKRLICLILCLAALPLAAQTLTVTKSGSNVVLTWSGGSGPFTVIRSDSPSMTTRTETLTGSTSPVTDTGAKTDGAKLHCYVISDPGPTVAIAAPAPGHGPLLLRTGATVVYCDTHTATGTTTWAACSDSTGPPIAVQADPKQGNAIVITAAAVDASGNWAYATVTGSYAGTITNRVPCKARAQGM